MALRSIVHVPLHSTVGVFGVVQIDILPIVRFVVHGSDLSIVVPGREHREPVSRVVEPEVLEGLREVDIVGGFDPSAVVGEIIRVFCVALAPAYAAALGVHVSLIGQIPRISTSYSIIVCIRP